MLPLFVPFAQAFAAVITAALTGSLYYIATAPKGGFVLTICIFHYSHRAMTYLCLISLIHIHRGFDADPTYVVAPVLQSRSGREDLKKLFAG